MIFFPKRNFLRLITVFGLTFFIFILRCPTSSTTTSNGLTPLQSPHKSSKVSSVISTPAPVLRSKRSPFIVAFQVTRPPGLFQLSMKKPVIMGVMSNMTSMLLGSELARMLSRGIASSGLLHPLNVTSTVGNSTIKQF